MFQQTLDEGTGMVDSIIVSDVWAQIRFEPPLVERFDRADLRPLIPWKTIKRTEHESKSRFPLGQTVYGIYIVRGVWRDGGPHLTASISLATHVRTVRFQSAAW